MRQSRSDPRYVLLQGTKPFVAKSVELTACYIRSFEKSMIVDGLNRNGLLVPYRSGLANITRLNINHVSGLNSANQCP